MLLTTNDFIGLFDAWAEVMNKNKEYLVELDTVVGDGDLGLAMSDGFGAMQQYVNSADTKDLGKFFYNAGKTMNAYASSSLGTLISAGFMEVGKAFKGKESMSGLELSVLLKSFENGIISRGKAKVGEKTFLDGFDPAVRVMNENQDEESVLMTLNKAALAAQEGSASTVGMLACWGRAARRGEDSRQILDPGSVVAALLIETMADYLNEKK